MRKWISLGVVALAFAAFVGVIALLVIRLQRPAAGPVEIVWDREPCAQCRMLIGERAFAAQLQTQDGRVLNFDDPGCLLKYEVERSPAVRATYFHRWKGQGWLTPDEVAFVPVPHSPMGYDLGAVEKGTPGSISLEAARSQVLGLAPRAEMGTHGEP